LLIHEGRGRVVLTISYTILYTKEYDHWLER